MQTAPAFLNRITAPVAAALFALCVTGFQYTADLPADKADRARVFSLWLGLAGFALLHYQRQVYDADVMPDRHRLVFFHFSWIGASAGVIGFVGPAMGMQVAMLGLFAAMLGFLVYPVRMMLRQQWAGLFLLLAFAAFCTDFWYQFFGGGVNAWKTGGWRFLVPVVSFSALLAWIGVKKQPA